MPYFLIEDVMLESISNFIKIAGKIKFEDIEKLQPSYSKFPVKVFVKAKRIGVNDFYYTKANIFTNKDDNFLTFQASLALPGNNKNYKIWAEVFSEQYSLGTISDEMNFNIY